MAVELPEPLQWVLLLLAGTRWPEADEDQLRDMAEHCRRTAEGLKDAAQSADSTIKRALDGQQGNAAEALGKYWEKYSVGKGTEEDPGYLPGAINALNGMGDMLEQVANSAETAKIQIIAQLGILAFELATAEAEAPFTAGASLLQVPAMIAASRVVVSQLLKQLLKETLMMAAKQAAQMGAINLLAQGIEVAEGHRKSIDGKELGQNVLGGAVGGASAHLIGKGIGAGGKKLGAENALNTTVGKMGTGAVVGVGADVSTQLITTGKVDSESLLGSGLSGGAGAGLHAGASAIKGHANAPKPAEMPHLDVPNTGGSHDGPATFNKPSTSTGDAGYHGPTGGSGSGSGTGTRSVDSGSGSGAGAGASHSTGGATHGGTETAAGTHTGTGSGTAAGESKVNGLAPFGSGRSTEAPASTGGSHEATPGSSGQAPRPDAAPPVSHESAQPRHEQSVRPDAAPPVSHEPALPRHEESVRQEAAPPVSHESTPRHEQSVRPDAAPPVSHESALPRHEESVRQEAAPAVSHESTPRHEQSVRPDAAPPVSHESAPPRHDESVRQEAAAPVSHESTPRQETVSSVSHESAPPRHEESVRQEAAPPVSHEPVGRQEQPVHDPVEQGGPRHEQPVQERAPGQQPAPHAVTSEHGGLGAAPRHESVVEHDGAGNAPRHEQPRHEPVTERQGPESTPRPEQPGTSGGPRPAVHEQPSAADHAAGHAGGPVRGSTPESSEVPSQRGGAAVPNLSGMLGGAAHLAGSGSDTHLDGGTRIAGGQTQTRPAPGPDTVPGHVVPDNAASAVQQPTGTPPMSGGFMPGPVAGGGGAHGAGGGGRTPSSHVPTGPVGSQRPAEPAPQPGGGSIRPGAGRTSDTHVPPPPPPPSQHRAGGTPRTLGDPNASSSRTGRTGEEHLPPPPPPPSGTSRLKPVDERPTPDELAQLHQHPGGPSLIHPAMADAAALAQYKSDNRFKFALPEDLRMAANALPHQAWGRRDSGVPTPSGRPDVKVSPYSQSFKTHLDPLTFKALHNEAAGAITPNLRTKLGDDAVEFSGNKVLEAAGNLDFRTQEHFQQQEIRRNVLERLARQDSEKTWSPVGEQRVNDHLTGSASAVDGVNRLLNGHNGHPGFDGVVLGESHGRSPSWRFLTENMHDLKAAGVDRIYVESLRDDAFQQHLDAYQRPGGTMSPNLETMLRAYDLNRTSPAGHGLYETVVRAKQEGVTIHAADGYPARAPQGGPHAMQERARLLNSYMNHAITDGGGTGKYVLVTGKAHVNEHASSTDHRIPGVAEMLGVPGVRLTDSGRPNPSGTPHDASADTASGNLRIGYLAPATTGHNSANAAGGHGAPPAPPAASAPHQGDGSSSQSTRSLGDSTPVPPAPPAAHQNGGSPSQSTRSLGGDRTPPPPPATPTQHSTAGSSQPGHRAPATTVPNTASVPGHHTPPAAGHNAPSTTSHGTPSTTGHTNAPAAGQHNAPASSAHEQFLDRQKQARDAELQALANRTPVRDAVDQLGREQRAVATPPVGADRLRQDLPGMSPQERAQQLASLTPENRRWLARDPQTVDALKNGLPPKEFARTAAELMVHVDPRAERAASARQEAQQQIARMLQDPETTARLLKNGADVVVVPKDVRMPDVPELNNLRGVHNNSSAGAGRGYDDMRGSGGRHSAVTEENLLGEHTPIGHGGHYEDGYSTTTHEFTHTVHRFGLDANDQKLITDTFNQKHGDPNAAWPDGPRQDTTGKPVDNYSSRDEQEYFAQVTNAYLGNNHGTDPYTGQPRNNGADWVRQNEPAVLPLLERLYGKDPGAVHAGPANPVHATTAENHMYEGFREFMDQVDGNGSNPPAHQPPTTPPPTAPTANAGQHGGSSSHLPPPPPNAPGFGSKPAADDGYSHKIDGEKTFDAIKDFLPDSAEFDKVKDSLKKYERSALIDGDTDAIMHAYEQQKQLHVDVLRRNVPAQLDAVNHRLDEIARETPNRQAELAGEKQNLETAKAHLEGQQDRLAVYEHELARLKGEPKSGTAAFKALQDARAQAEPRIAKDAMERIEDQRKSVADLRTSADQRFQDAENAYQTEKNKRIAAGGKDESAAEKAAKTTRNVYESRVEDLKLRERELAQDLQARKDALAGNYGATPPKPKKGADQLFADGAYRAAFGYSDHGVMAGEPHAEKTARRMDDGKVKLGAAVVNRNHVVADYMVHKYVTAAVFKARSFGDEQHRVEASRTFSDFVDTMAPDQHRVFDKAGKQAVKRLGANEQEHAALAWRDLGYTAKDVDLGKAYGNDKLEAAFAPAKLDDPASAGAARDEVHNQLNRSGLDGPARAELDRYAETVQRFSDDPSPQHLAEMKSALADVRTKVREQAVEDLALVHGITGPRHLDDTVAAARQAASEPPAGPGNSPAHERLADRIEDLARSYDRLGHDRQDLKSLAEQLRNDPNAVRPDQLEAFADKLPNEREQLRQDEVDRRRQEAAQTLKPGGTAAAQQKAAEKLLPKADADIAAVAQQYGGGFPRAGAGANHPAGLFDRAVQAKVEDVPKLIEEITAGLSNSASNLRFGDELTNKWIQNFLDPHVVRDQDVLTAVAKGDLPPEALYAPHTLDLLRGLRTLEDTGLAPRELRDLMAPKTEADMVDLHQPGQKPSASAVNIADEHGMLNHAGGETPVSSSGDFTRQPGQSANPVVGSEALHDPARDARPGAEGHEIGTTPAPATPRPPASQDTDVVMASQDHDTPMPSQSHDTPMLSQSQSQDHAMASQQTVRPEKRRLDPDDDMLMPDAPPTKRRATDAVPTPPPPPPSVAHQGAPGAQGLGAHGFGTLPSPPPPVATRGTGTTEHASGTPDRRQGEPMDVDQPTRTVPHQRDADGDAVMHEPDATGGSNGRKRGREDESQNDDRQSGADREVKRRRTPSYENTDAVMHDRGYRRIGPEHELTGKLVDYLGGEPKVHPPMSNSLLQKVNPHETPVRPGENFRSGDDLNACLENVEAYRDTHFGRPRVSGRTEHGTVEPIPGNTLWKRHDGPARFGEGPAAVQKLMDRVKEGGPGSFATVLGTGAHGDGHAVALVHDRDGTLRWADLTDRKVSPATGDMPANFRNDWTVWASVADPHENNISGQHDPDFMDRYSTFTDSGRSSRDESPEPMDVDGFGNRPRASSAPPELGTHTPESAPAHVEPQAVHVEPQPVVPKPDLSHAVREFPPPGPLVKVTGDGLCLLHSLDASAPGLAGPRTAGGGGAPARRLQSAVESHFRELPPEAWPTEVVANYRNNRIVRGNLGRSELLDYLPADSRGAFAQLPPAQLKDIVTQHLTDNAPPPSARERAALLDTVRNWEGRWRTTEGEMLPAAAAHALGLRMRVLDHNGIPRAVFGPEDGRQVTVYHEGDHYDGSVPPRPSGTHEGPAPAQPHQQPEVKPEQKPEPKAEQQPEQKPEPKAEPKAETAPEQKPEVPQESHVQESEPKPALSQEPEQKPAPAPEATPPASGPRPIAGTDLVVGLTANEVAVRQRVVDVLANAVPGDRAAARAFADAHFGPATLRPMLGALSRGETWKAAFEHGAWSGSITLRGEVIGSRHLRTDKIEFENGADRTVAIGNARDSQWQYNIGVQARQSAGVTEPAELVGYFHDRGQGEVSLDLGGMVARSKTSEPADVFASTMRLELDFGDLRHDGAPVRTGSARTEEVDLGLTVAVPKGSGTTGPGEQRTPPQRLLDGRVGGQEIVLDLAPRGGADDHRPVEGLLDHVEAAARQEFGSNWPAMREKVLAEVDFGRLQRDLKSMTAGEPVSVTLTDRRGKSLGTLEIRARVGELRQSGTTKETEFNIGTSVQQVRSSAQSRGNAGQFGLANVLKPGSALITTGGAGRLGRDRIEITGDSRVSQLTSKSKVPGVLYDGPVHFEMAFNGKADVHPAGEADVRLLVDRADTTAPEPETSKSESAKSEPSKSVPEGSGSELETHEVTGPPESVWHGGNDRGGLGETVVVRDLESTKALRDAVDQQGRAKFGDDWDAVREQVLRGFSQPNLAARLTGMTRGEALEVKVPGQENLVVRATARVREMTYRREDGKAELNVLNETSAFTVDRSLLSRTVAGNGQLGGAVVKGAPGGDLLAAGSGQQRERAGGQGRQADRVYANGKYSAPQVIYGAELAVDLHFGRPGEAAGARPDVTAPVRIEVGLDARDTVKVQAPRGEDGRIAFKPPAESSRPSEETVTRPSTEGRDGIELTRQEPAAEGRKGTEVERPAAPHLAPRRMREQHELNASYVVHSLGGGDRVRTVVSDAIREKYGKPSDEMQQKIDGAFDRIAMKTQLSQLTRGGKVTETISGATWKAEVTVTARVGEATYHSKADKYEFESGTRTSSGQGGVRDSRNRLDGGGRFNARTPVLAVSGGYSYRTDRSYGQNVETIGSTSNRGKHVEPAVFFDVHAAYDVSVTFKRLNVPDGSFAQPVEAVARVAVPMRDAEPTAGPVERTTEKQPRGFVEGRRLDSSAIVTDVYGLPGRGGAADGPRQTLGESLLSQVESGWKPKSGGTKSGPASTGPKLERNPFGSDWAGIREKLDAELTPDRLQSRLKGMTAGDEIVVRHGRTTVRVGAVLRERMEHLGDSGTTEFNTGNDVQRTFQHADGTGTSHQGLLGVTGAAPIAGTPVSVTAGLTGTGGGGHDHADVRSSSTSAGAATKAKLPGSAYRGEAELQFTIERRPWVGASVAQRRTATVGFETIVESGETMPVRTGSGDEAPPRTVPAKIPEQVSVPVPPERVWESGLRDTDVLRFLGDVGGVQDLVRLRGEQYFGKSDWKEMAPIVGTVTSHSHLSALFGTASQGAEVAATVPTGRISLGGGKGVEVGVKLVELEHRTNDSAVEFSPANASSSGTAHADLSAKNAGAQAQVGARITGDVSNNPALTGGAQRIWREGGSHADAGQVISNGKFAVPMARYHGAAEVEVTMFDNDRTPVKEKGIVPFTVDIPLAETTGSNVPGDHYLAFNGEQRSGELRFGEDARLLDDVHRVLDGDGSPYDHTTRTPAERERLSSTVRLGKAVYEREFTAATEAGRARIEAAHRLVELSGGNSDKANALLGTLLGTPEGAPVNAADARKVLDFLGRRAGQGPVTLDDLAAGAKADWPAHETRQVHRAAWTDRGPASELVTAAMATAADAAGPLLRGGVPACGQLHLTVAGEGPGLPVIRSFDLDGTDPAEQIRRIEGEVYLGGGNRPQEVTVRLAGPENWDYRVTARPGGERELTLRQLPSPAPDTPGTPDAGAPAGQPAPAPEPDPSAARATALAAFVAGLTGGTPEGAA
ncbi:toxin glutamine deamidase domain-containing protein [Streptomyces sp. TLI_171]|uniref:WXG100-like domain-containing protein n=1 Tax=Streptomyces sp. TLI_171 TaxID=1938859 RepID=UPI000C1A515C|nr:toxin glutamine deamidase domain-containing protein [Streptomyces sp. TLI_171]RKE22230.1 papain fold toxin 1 (glutamine deamidase) of polymorphic toxin system [Streptomyces sp. TLI_171]